MIISNVVEETHHLLNKHVYQKAYRLADKELYITNQFSRKKVTCAKFLLTFSSIMLCQLAVALVFCFAGVLSAPSKVCAPNQWSAFATGKVGQTVNGTAMVLTSRYGIYIQE